MFVITVTLCDTVVNIAPTACDATGIPQSVLTVCDSTKGRGVSITVATERALCALAYALSGADSDRHPQHAAAYEVQHLLDEETAKMYAALIPKEQRTLAGLQELLHTLRIVP